MMTEHGFHSPEKWEGAGMQSEAPGRRCFPVEVYALWIEEDLEAPVLPWLRHFSPERQRMIQRYRRVADRSRTVWAELLARCLLCRAASASWEEVSIERDAGGKPRGKVSRGSSRDAWEISLSHSGPWILCSIGRGASGVDVETEADGFEEIARQFFRPEEAAALQRTPLPGRKREFLCYWTVKESYLKCTGEGLAGGDLSKVDCAALWSGAQPLAAKNFLLPDGAVAGICAGRDCLPMHVNFMPPGALKRFLETGGKAEAP